MELPEENPFVIIGKLIYCSMIIFAYPLVIYVTNQMIEYYIFGCMKYTVLRKWLKNLSRTLVILIAALIAVSFYYKLHIINGFIGVILGGIIVMIIPSIIHNRIVA